MSVRLDVPYISQYNAAGTGGNNCGPAGIAMLLAARGAIPATQEAMWECADLARDGVSDDVGMEGGYTTFQQLASVAASYGCPTTMLYSWDAVRGSLDAGEGVVLLVDNTVLAPREYPVSPAFNAMHFITLTGYATETGTAPTNDPLAVDYGPGEYYYWSVQAGATDAGGVQGLALVPLAVEDSIPMETTAAERAAMKPYFDQLGQDCNMETMLMGRACLAFKRGESRGPATSGEYPAATPDGQASVRQNFSAGIAEARQKADGSWEANWVEVVLHPDSITG
jgi:Peptidase_C39 like family